MKIQLTLDFDRISILYKLTQLVYESKVYDSTGVGYSLAKKFQSKYQKIIESNMALDRKFYKISLKQYEAILLEKMCDKQIDNLQPSDFEDRQDYYYNLNFLRDVINEIHPKLI
jgi:hypothetical protein